jgi:hypothetical protein
MSEAGKPNIPRPKGDYFPGPHTLEWWSVLSNPGEHPSEKPSEIVPEAPSPNLMPEAGTDTMGQEPTTGLMPEPNKGDYARPALGGLTPRVVHTDDQIGIHQTRSSRSARYDARYGMR